MWETRDRNMSGKTQVSPGFPSPDPPGFPARSPDANLGPPAATAFSLIALVNADMILEVWLAI